MIDLATVGLPTAPDVERYVLGSLINSESSRRLMAVISPELFAIDRHRQLLQVIVELWDAGSHIDRVTVVQEFAKRFPASDVFAFIADIDEGLPEIHNIEAYVAVLEEKAALRRIAHAAHLALTTAISQNEAASDIARSLQGALELKSAAHLAALMDPTEIIDAAGGINEFAKAPRAGIPTPWPALTRLTNGFRPGEVTVLAANAGMGKSSAAMQMAGRAAEWGAPSCVFSLEMSRQELMVRMVCSRAGVDSALYRRGGLSDHDRRKIFAAASEITQWPLRIAEEGSSTVPAIRSMIRREKMLGRPPEFVVIDYLQLMNATGRGANRHAELSEITRGVKLLAKDEHVSIVLLSQLSRANAKDKRPPTMSDLRDSGSIEENADAILFAWRPEVVMPPESAAQYRGLAQLILAKQRNGPVGTIEMVFQHEYTRFEERYENAA